jgi:CHASE1-domain containing sensor protein
VFVIALVLSGLASYFLLRRQREAFARRVERRAERMQERFERARSREDAD